MLIGLNFAKCVQDIFENKVDIDQVLVIIDCISINPHNERQWDITWHGYHDYVGLGLREWANYNEEATEKLRDITIKLYDSGKLHQLSRYGALRKYQSIHWLETIVPIGDLDNHPAVKEAWERFQVVASLTGLELDRK